ncbi:NACHT domain-containing protein [Anabaena sp. AL09]|uniref:NACHT domain-containing protein n=1 Tax=Anabaena sp. AL09 TaxID=1710891 RepID=UPI000800B843|nr:NACHT domain-containing protein [Anabaena sp. AL09]OBQ01406.1 MAG: ATPase [Anabaena sp. AL09]
MNNIEDILQYIDNLMFEETESNLTPIEKTILTGVWQKQAYSIIAKNFHCSESKIKQEAAKLWKKLGQVLGEDINSDNVRSRVEKKYRVSQASHSGDCLLLDNINIGGQFIQTNNYRQEHFKPPQPKHQTPIIDLTKVPELNYNYGRNSEVTTLKEWILENKTRLITIYGLSGIGKTALTLKLISEIKTEFDYIIYRSLDHLPQLITLKDKLKQFFSQSQSNPLPEIIDYFNSSRCLLIIDDVDNIFQFGNLAGQYLTEYKDYSKFFQQIATSSHQSCLILISSAKPPDIETLEIQNKHTKTLHLQGLGKDAKAILREKGLKDEDKWDELIRLYQGHPDWLNIIILTIIEFFNGKVSLFITANDDLFLGDIEALLENHLERLSELENKVINWLATQNEPIDIFQKPADFELSNARFLQIIQSLTRRCLVEKVLREEGVKFQLNSLLKVYLDMK